MRIKTFKLFESESEVIDLTGLPKLEYDTVLKPGDLIGVFNPYHPGVSLLNSKDPFWTFIGWKPGQPGGNGLEIWIASDKLKQIRSLTSYEMNNDKVYFKKGNSKIKGDLKTFDFERNSSVRGEVLEKYLNELIKKEGSFTSINREVDPKAFITEINNKLEIASSRYEYRVSNIDGEYYLTKEASYKRSTPKWDELLRVDIESILKDQFEILKDKIYSFDDYRLVGYEPSKFPKELNGHQQHELRGERDYSVRVAWKLKKK